MNREKAGILMFLRVGIISIVFLFGLTMMVLGSETALSNIKIKFANDSEINIFTSKMKVSEILEEANIILLADETVTPGLEEQITNDKKIVISKKSDLIALAEVENQEIDLANLSDEYAPMTEKMLVITEEIPFETIQKDAKGDGTKSNKVLQKGVNGLKETTYRVKYKNELEISREEVSNKIIKEPVNKIVQVTYTPVTSRGSAPRTEVNYSGALAAKVSGIEPKVLTFNSSAYCACYKCCGKNPGDKGYGRTASGAQAQALYTVAAGKGYKLGTVVYIPYFKDKANGGWFVVQDRGGAISNNKLDVYMNTHNECLQFGRKNLTAYVYEI